ncbi:hypothetical protein GYMLUDRAFT_260319 [Collybiopsis luxurians FD-317 M1]|uniref:Dyp-type peroxidase n=1 Tax=Collybiopsis luxurians FD-317 M1 TaxID=944289 RepID=A0A0D0BFJ0_9AGAR|nr:hypothetical protein GYMLUDRAFT_260319 [Collybiopsis luxurians FD-317 M1]
MNSFSTSSYKVHSSYNSGSPQQLVESMKFGPASNLIPRLLSPSSIRTTSSFAVNVPYKINDSDRSVDITIPPGFDTEVLFTFQQKRYKQVIVETWPNWSTKKETYHANYNPRETGKSAMPAQKNPQKLNLAFLYFADGERTPGPSRMLNIFSESNADTFTLTIISRDKGGSPPTRPADSDMYAKVILYQSDNFPPPEIDEQEKPRGQIKDQADEQNTKPNNEDEAPDLGNIQAEIVPGLNKAFEYFLFFRIENVTGFRDTMKAKMIPRISTAMLVFDMLKKKQFPANGLPKEDWEYVGCSVGFSAIGLAKLGLTDYLYDEAFQRGQRRDAKDLGDKGTESEGDFQVEWDAEFLGEIHGVFQITAHNDSKGKAFVRQLKKDFGYSRGIQVIQSISTKFRPMPHTRMEHFGFRDGISKPEIKGYTFDDELPIRFPGSPIVEPGCLLMGRKGDLEKDRRPAWAVDGSFFVFRKLKQYVPEFHNFLRQNGTRLYPDLKPDDASHKLGARMFGRWKSGTPVVLSPDRDDESISNDDKRINNFQYPGDQSKCPFAAHTQKSYPRGNLPGSNDHVFRRASITYGGELDASETETTKNDRGLLFLCYQSSIERGFKYIQQRYNNPDFPSANLRADSPGYDPIMGTIPRYMTGLNLTKTSEKLSVPLQFVEARGGEYFFMPSISTLDKIATDS